MYIDLHVYITWVISIGLCFEQVITHALNSVQL